MTALVAFEAAQLRATSLSTDRLIFSIGQMICDMQNDSVFQNSMKSQSTYCRVPVDSPQRFRVELLFSPGANFSPYEVVPLHKDHTLPVQPRACLHKGQLTLSDGHLLVVQIQSVCCALACVHHVVYFATLATVSLFLLCFMRIVIVNTAMLQETKSTCRSWSSFAYHTAHLPKHPHIRTLCSKLRYDTFMAYVSCYCHSNM